MSGHGAPVHDFSNKGSTLIFHHFFPLLLVSTFPPQASQIKIQRKAGGRRQPHSIAARELFICLIPITSSWSQAFHLSPRGRVAGVADNMRMRGVLSPIYLIIEQMTGRINDPGLLAPLNKIKARLLSPRFHLPFGVRYPLLLSVPTTATERADPDKRQDTSGVLGRRTGPTS
jgi:hypothetical protein